MSIIDLQFTKCRDYQLNSRVLTAIITLFKKKQKDNDIQTTNDQLSFVTHSGKVSIFLSNYYFHEVV